MDDLETPRDDELVDRIFGSHIEDSTTPYDQDEDDDWDDPELSAYLKYDYDGAESIEELISRFEAQIVWFTEKLDAGWTLSSPVDNAWVHFNKPEVKEGS